MVTSLLQDMLWNERIFLQGGAVEKIILQRESRYEIWNANRSTPVFSIPNKTELQPAPTNFDRIQQASVFIENGRLHSLQ